MNTLALGFNVISILIVLLALVIAGVTYIIARLMKNTKIFHSAVELIDVALLIFMIFVFLLNIAGLAVLMLITIPQTVNTDGLIIPLFLAQVIFIYLLVKQGLYYSMTKLFNSKYGKAV